MLGCGCGAIAHSRSSLLLLFRLVLDLYHQATENCSVGVYCKRRSLRKEPGQTQGSGQLLGRFGNSGSIKVRLKVCHEI